MIGLPCGEGLLSRVSARQYADAR